MQIERENTGTVLNSTPKTSVEKILIPDVPKEKQELVSLVVIESLRESEEAKKAVLDSIMAVESSIQEELQSS